MTSQTQASYKRRIIRVILPAIQLRLAVMVLLSCVGALGLHLMLIVRGATRLASDYPDLPAGLREAAMEELWSAMWVSIGILVPLSFLVGVHVSSKFAGPLYRMRVFLEEVVAGTGPADMQLRRGDQLQDLSALINKATAGRRKEDRAESRQEAA